MHVGFKSVMMPQNHPLDSSSRLIVFFFDTRAVPEILKLCDLMFSAGHP